VTELPFKFDEIGYWSELKLEIIEKYGAAYTTAFANFLNLKKNTTSTASAAPASISRGKPEPGSRAVLLAP
jgi:hypothetical protein